ncbi:hypothetical protein LINPERPRIM_LOCUS17533 [Linum perenne]
MQNMKVESCRINVGERTQRIFGKHRGCNKEVKGLFVFINV